MSFVGRPAQRGASALVVVVLLYAAMVITVMFVHRTLVYEQRSSANLVRAAMAQEVAEAGLDWATVRLRDASRLSADCLPATEGQRFFDLTLAYATDGAGLLPRASGVPVAACIAPTDGGAWRCRCGVAATPPRGEGDAGPGFTIEFAQRAGARVVDVLSRACAAGSPGQGCADGAPSVLRVTLALRPALASSPGAALMARGSVAAGAAALGVHNPDAASGGVALRAGTGVDAPSLRASGPAGTPSSTVVVDRDATLAASSPRQLFHAVFGVPRDTWRDSFADAVLDCPCDVAAVAAALANGAHKLWLRGDLELDTGLVLGDDGDPVVLVVDGTLQLRGPLRMHGLLYAAAVEGPASVAGAAAAARVAGAVISESHWQVAAPAELVYDPQVIARLRAMPGAFVRVPGSWRDDPSAP